MNHSSPHELDNLEKFAVESRERVDSESGGDNGAEEMAGHASVVARPGCSTPQASSSKPQTLLEWRVWLVAKRPGRATAALALMLGGCLVIALAMAAAALGLVAFVLLMSATREFFFPVRYRLTDEGAWAEGVMNSHFIPWGKVKACYLSEEGLKLSPFRRANRLEPFRGVYLRFAGNRGEVVDKVKGLAKEREIE